MEHVTDIELECLLDGTLSFLKKTLVKLHLKRCLRCRKQLEKLREERSEFEGMTVVVRKLEDADRKSRQATCKVMTGIFQTPSSGGDE